MYPAVGEDRGKRLACRGGRGMTNELSVGIKCVGVATFQHAFGADAFQITGKAVKTLALVTQASGQCTIDLHLELTEALARLFEQARSGGGKLGFKAGEALALKAQALR